MFVHLYGEPSTRTLDLRNVADYLRERLGQVGVDVRDEFTGYHLAEGGMEGFARGLASVRVRDLDRKVVSCEPMLGEVEFERRALKKPEGRYPGALYDGFLLQSLLAGILKEDEADMRHAHIAFTNRLFCTFDEGDKRYHARVIVCGYPSLISTTGIVEAPAKPREFYLAMRAQLGPAAGSVMLEGLKEGFRGRFIDYDDERMTEVMKGYVMQAIFYHLFGEAFCSDRRCRLRNSHWQEEVIEAQLAPREKEFCDRHFEMLAKLKRTDLLD